MEAGSLGDMGLGDDGGGLPDVEGGAEGEPIGDEEPVSAGEAAKDNPLLAAPAKRHDKRHEKDMTTTPNSRGKMYLPVKHTGGDKRNSGARKRSYLSKAATEKGSGTKRNVMGGALELFSLANGVYEGVDSEDNSRSLQEANRNEEKKIFEVSQEIKTLIRGLEKKDEK